MTELITTIYLAAVYALVALGISLTWAGLGFLNLAHGVTFAAAGYGAWWAQEHISDHRARRLARRHRRRGDRRADHLPRSSSCRSTAGRTGDFRSLIATLGLAIIGVNTYLLVFGPQRKAIDFLVRPDQVQLGDTTITADKSGAIISATVVMVLVVARAHDARGSVSACAR